jgi:hypothetical protein
MTEMLPIRRVKEYWNEFVAGPFQKNGSTWFKHNTWLIKKQLLDAFQKEIFGQITFKLGKEAVDIRDKEALSKLPGVQNILQQGFRKWRRLCILCGEHGIPFIQVEDLAESLKEDSNGDIPDGHMSLEGTHVEVEKAPDRGEADTHDSTEGM